MLQTLQLTNFRSYDNGLFGFEPGVNIVVGPNASGKTNLLEAISTVCMGQGFKSADKDLISIGQEWARVEGMTDEEVRVVKLQLDKPKQLEIDGMVKKRFSGPATLPVVVFEPEHMLMLGNESARRRDYLDGILSTTTLGHKQNLVAYKRALAQRNRLLKQEFVSPEQLFVWDLQLTERASSIVLARLELVEKLNNSCQGKYQSISSHTEKLTLTYVGNVGFDNYAHNLLRYLKENFEKDRLRGFTSAGPHRDDLSIELKNTNARTTASRGETRSIILALKVAELELIEDSTNRQPILLLDDVFSELDGSRRRSLAEALQKYQTFLTTTDADVVVDHFSNHNIIPV